MLLPYEAHTSRWKVITVYWNANLSILMWDHLSVLHSWNYFVPRRLDEVVMQKHRHLASKSALVSIAFPCPVVSIDQRSRIGIDSSLFVYVLHCKTYTNKANSIPFRLLWYRLNITEGMSGMSHDRKRGAREPGYHVNVGFSNDWEICFANLPRRVEQGRVDIKSIIHQLHFAKSFSILEVMWSISIHTWAIWGDKIFNGLSTCLRDVKIKLPSFLTFHCLPHWGIYGVTAWERRGGIWSWFSNVWFHIHTSQMTYAYFATWL